jgi:carbamoyl-phosphate synthase large subunit
MPKINLVLTIKEGVSMTQYNILVTSIGGDLGQAVCKALRYSNYHIKIYGTDCKEYVPNHLFCDSFQTIPKAGSKVYIEAINRLILKNAIDLIYICSEQELLYICDNFEEIPPEIRTRIVIPPLPVINICRDKFKTMQFLKDNKLPYPYSRIYDKSISIDTQLNDFKYPLIVKKISDCGSKYLHIISSFKEFEAINHLDHTYMLQEYISGTEYTNAVYRDAFSDEIYVISFERSLKDGMSYEAKVVFNRDIEELCKKVATKLNLRGAINIQLRQERNKEPVIFEINPRYSSTAFMRAKFGFNDVIYAFENSVLQKTISPPQIKAGEAYRYITEYYKYY